MKKIDILRLTALVLCCALLVVWLPMSTPAKASAIAGLVDEYTTGSGTFDITTDSRFFIVSTQQPSEKLVGLVQLSASEFAADGVPSATTLPIVWGHEDAIRSGDIVIRLDSSYESEAYRLKTTTEGATVTACDHSGVRYGLQMLLKHSRLGGKGSTAIPVFEMYDHPDTAQRIFRLDMARKYFSKEFIINMIREMSWMGFNQLELHLTDDAGIRLDIWDETYFESDNDFSWICGGDPAWWVEAYHPQNADPNKDKILTAADMIEILEVAKTYDIEVVPSMNTPGHSEYMTRQYEAYHQSTGGFTFVFDNITYDSTTYPTINYNGGTNTKYACIALNNYAARGFALAMIQDYADFFKQYGNSDHFHIGADEVVFTSGSYNCVTGWDTFAQNDLGIANGTAYDTYYRWLNTVASRLKSRGYKVRAFNDFLELDGMAHTATLDPDIEITYWSTDSNDYGMATAQEFADQGRKVYNGIQSYSYYVLRQYDQKDSAGNVIASYDARDPANPNDGWAFTYATAENIWNEWDPTLFSQHTDSTQVRLTSDQVAGAYYMVWCDHGGYDTEYGIWMGDWSESAKYDKGEYAIRPRMRASITKMMHADASEAMSYEDFYGLMYNYIADFPGYAGIGASVTLPKATDPVHVYRADHSALAALLGEKLDPAPYTVESYATYETAYAEARVVNANYDASADEIAAATQKLQAALDALELEPVGLTVYHKVQVGDEEWLLGSEEHEITPQTTYQIPIPDYTGFTKPVDEAGDTMDQLTGTLEGDQVITLWYGCSQDLQALAAAVAAAPKEQDMFTNASWSVYEPVMTDAVAYFQAIKASPTTADQSLAGEKAQALTEAAKALVARGVQLTVIHKTMVGQTERVLRTDVFENVSLTALYRVSVGGYTNYRYSHIVDGDIQFVDFGADIGVITGTIQGDTTVVVWYDNVPSLNGLLESLSDAPSDGTGYTADSWNVYSAALQEAQSFRDSVKDDLVDKTYQEQIDAVTAKLEQAKAQLTKTDGDGTLLDAALTSQFVSLGRQAVIRVETSPDVAAVTVALDGQAVTPDRIASGTSFAADGSEVKVWLVYISMDTAGTYQCVVSVGDQSRTLSIQCK
ncbi:MAG: family 20 glycosylhydrolase [Oscillospiraceae bacterium]|nr:family 20 glycosylhydrolase [Oscillospiraceae bacterium]